VTLRFSVSLAGIVVGSTDTLTSLDLSFAYLSTTDPLTGAHPEFGGSPQGIPVTVTTVNCVIVSFWEAEVEVCEREEEAQGWE
jgi:hypothetical protein